MAETITRQYREPFVETAGLATTEEGLRLLKQQIPTGTYTGKQFVAPQTALEQQAQAAATGLSGLLGPTAYQQFESPYQQDVIQTTQDLLERQRQQGLGALQAQAVGAGAFGGAREGVARGAYEAERDIGAAQLLAQLRQAGLQQAQQQAAQAFVQQQALAQEQARQAGQGFTQQQALSQEQARQAQLGQQLAQQQITGLGQLGGQQRQIEQARLAADQEAAREAAFADFTRLGLVGPQLASVIGGFPAATQVQSTPPPSTSQQLLGLGIGGLGLAGAARGIFG